MDALILRYIQLQIMHYINNIAQWQIIIMYITYGKVFGGLRKCLCFGYFLKMEAFRSDLLTGH